MLHWARAPRWSFYVGGSAISELCYHRAQTLTFTFTDGKQYEIPNFPVFELMRWLGAPSKGEYWNLNVRGKY